MPGGVTLVRVIEVGRLTLKVGSHLYWVPGLNKMEEQS